jgi:hypothetical protein
MTDPAVGDRPVGTTVGRVTTYNAALIRFHSLRSVRARRRQRLLPIALGGGGDDFRHYNGSIIIVAIIIIGHSKPTILIPPTARDKEEEDGEEESTTRHTSSSSLSRVLQGNYGGAVCRYYEATNTRRQTTIRHCGTTWKRLQKSSRATRHTKRGIGP